jgi:hypothetical protein
VATPFETIISVIIIIIISIIVIIINHTMSSITAALIEIQKLNSMQYFEVCSLT